MPELEERFDEVMLSIYKRAKAECDYNASRFFQMLTKHGGVQTAKILLHSSGVSEGFVALWERRRLDLTVEAHVLDASWSSLFSDEETTIARNRLKEYGYDVA